MAFNTFFLSIISLKRTRFNGSFRGRGIIHPQKTDRGIMENNN